MTPDNFPLGRSACLRITLLLLFLLANAGRMVGADSSRADERKELFKSNCAICHGEDGTGTPLGKRLQAPDLTSRTVQSRPNTALEQMVKTGKNSMPPFADRLDDQHIKSLILFVRRLAANAAAAKK
jgi:cytochrome c6